jgi:peptide/nickel transport system permease protein
MKRTARPPGAPPHSRYRPAIALLAGLVGVGYLAPLLANERPIAVLQGGRLSFPAAADLEIIGSWFSGTVPLGGHVLPAPIPWSYRGIDLDEAMQRPSTRHLFGTDALGRDLLARVVHGASVSLLVGFLATLLALGIGGLLGGLAALRGGLTDLFLTRIVEVLSCFPPFLLALALLAAGRGGIGTLILAVGLARAAAAARFVRGEVLRWKEGPVFLAARSAGGSLPWVAVRHLIPMSAEPLAVQATFGVAYAILLEATLSFLGVGVQPPTPSWGMVLAEGRATIETAWWPILFPAAALALTLLALGVAAHAADPGTDSQPN